MKHKENRN